MPGLGVRATFVPIKEEYEKFCQLPKQDLHEFNWLLQGTVNLGAASVVKTVAVSREHRGQTGWLRAAGQWGWRTTVCRLESQCIWVLLMDTQPAQGVRWTSWNTGFCLVHHLVSESRMLVWSRKAELLASVLLPCQACFLLCKRMGLDDIPSPLPRPVTH